jgi:hypothetical protein
MRNEKWLRMLLMISMAALSAIVALPTHPAAQCPEGMISYWKFDEGTGMAAADSVGTNPGVLAGTIPEWTTGQVGSALKFTGTLHNNPDIVTVPHNATLTLTSKMTIELWFNPEDNVGPGAYHGFLDKFAAWADWEVNYGLWYYDHDPNQPPTMPTLQVAWRSDEYIAWKAPYSFAANTWHHIVVTVDFAESSPKPGVPPQFYVNGVLLSGVYSNEHYGSFPPIGNTAPLVIGKGLGSASNGILDEVAIYNRRLTPEEVQQHYQNALLGVGYCETPLAFDGFYSPVDNNIVNEAKAGQTIPVKWRLTDINGAPISEPGSFVKLMSYGIACDTSTEISYDAIEEYAAGKSGLQYIGDGYWQFNWKTPKNYASTCRAAYVVFNNTQTSPVVEFKFKK